MTQQEVAAATWDAPPRSHTDRVSIDLRVVKSLTLKVGRYSTAGFLPHLSTLMLCVSVVSGTYLCLLINFLLKVFNLLIFIWLLVYRVRIRWYTREMS